MAHKRNPNAFDFSISDMGFGFMNRFYTEFMSEMKIKNNFTYKDQDPKYERALIN